MPKFVNVSGAALRHVKLKRCRPGHFQKPYNSCNLIHSRLSYCLSYTRTIQTSCHWRVTEGSTSGSASKSSALPERSSYEDPHGIDDGDTTTDLLEDYIVKLVQGRRLNFTTPVPQLFQQYIERAGTVIEKVIPYEEHPLYDRRADSKANIITTDSEVGDGLVLVVHLSTNSKDQSANKLCICSGFVVKTHTSDGSRASTDTIITCAHTLEEMHRYLRRASQKDTQSFSFALTSDGEPRVIHQVISSMPRSDIVALETAPSTTSFAPLRSLPLSPFPVYTGNPVLTHLFGSPEPSLIQRSKARIAAKTELSKEEHSVEEPSKWLGGQGWRRWGRGTMLGYRSYTGQEIEAGISSVLPHIMTSILPTSGSSGGPLVNADTGSVVGMISGRRMDNRVEGERGWGASAEGIFEMFSLPGFIPASRGRG